MCPMAKIIKTYIITIVKLPPSCPKINLPSAHIESSPIFIMSDAMDKNAINGMNATIMVIIRRQK